MEKVILTKVQKHLKKLPIYIVRNLQRWAMQIETLGLAEVRKIPGYHDEPLLGARKGQRSVRLSRQYRVIYTEMNDQHIKLIVVEEVNKHEY